MDDLVVGSKLRKIIDVWPEIQAILEIGRLDSVVFTERIFKAEKMALYVDDEHVGLWRPLDEDMGWRLLCDLGTSNFAQDASCDPEGWVNWRLLPSDYLKIIDAAKTIAGRVEGETSSAPFQREKGAEMEKDIVGAGANLPRLLPKSELLSITSIVRVVAQVSEGKLTVAEVAHALTYNKVYNGDIMIYWGGSNGLAEPIIGDARDENSGYNQRLDIVCDLSNCCADWDTGANIPVRPYGRTDTRYLFVSKEDGENIAARLWQFFYPKQEKTIDISRKAEGLGNKQSVEKTGYSTPHLAILNAAIAEFFEPRRERDAKREEVVGWIKSKMTAFGMADSDNIAQAIFTIIKPVDHAPRKRRG